MAILDAIYSLGSKINKFSGNKGEETEEGVVSEKLPELTVKIDNEKLLKLTEAWEKKWVDSDVKRTFDENGKDNEEYWKGQQFDVPMADKRKRLMDNVIFESLETYLPQVTRRNPDPQVTLSRSEEQTAENLAYATNLQKELGEIADEMVVRLKMKKAARHWAIYLLGALKPGWDLNRDMPTCRVIRPKKLILDPEANVDEDGYTGEFIGEYRKLPASKLIDIIESVGGEDGAVDLINKMVKDKEGKKASGTEIGFIEWWTDEYMCWTIAGKQVLLKVKNPHWNYDTENEAPYTDQGEPQMDENGQVMMETVKGVNHFAVPKKPYILLSVFNLGKQPVDETSLIGQNIASQDLVNKRLRQIDKNADSMNGGMVVSGERSGLTQQQAKGVSDALRKGGTIFIPTGAVNDAVARMSAPSLPGDVFVQLQDTRNRMRDIFGTSGSSLAGLSSEKTVRGKLQGRILDTDRIGGGFSEYLEQMADSLYNWFTQLLYVYDDRYAKKMTPKVIISVKEGSLLPKDSTTMANQAIELAGAGKMSLIDLYKALDYPNPEEMAANVWLEANAPDMLFKNDTRIQQVVEAQKQAQAPDAPSRSISFGDLPPDGQAQLAAQAGITLDPEGIAVHNQLKSEKEFEKELKLEMGKKSIDQSINKDKQV